MWIPAKPVPLGTDADIRLHRGFSDENDAGNEC